MTICKKCNEEGGDGLYCNSCGARFDKERACPKCGAALGAAARYCPACGCPLDTKGTAAPRETAGGGYRGGDIGILRGNIDGSTHTSNASFGGASTGNIIIGIPPTQPSGPPQTICPVCGEYPELRASFRCLRCNRDYICLRHRDTASNWCRDCAAPERKRRETESKRSDESSRNVEVERGGMGENLDRVEAGSDRGSREGTGRTAGPQQQDAWAHGQQEQAPPMRPAARLLSEGVIWTNAQGPDLMSVVCEVLQSFGATDVRPDPQSQTVTGKTGLTWKSIGQIISATIRPLPDGSSVTVVSKPKPPQLMDGGRGASDARQIAGMLLQRLGAGR